MANYKKPGAGRYGTKIKQFTNAFGKWDSKDEFRRFLFLQDLEKKGTIQGLEIKNTWSFNLNGVHIGKFSPDFVFKVGAHIVVEDFKGGFAVSRDFPLRVKMLKAFYGLDVIIVKNVTEIKHIEDLRVN